MGGEAPDVFLKGISLSPSREEEDELRHGREPPPENFDVGKIDHGNEGVNDKRQKDEEKSAKTSVPATKPKIMLADVKYMLFPIVNVCQSVYVSYCVDVV